ncbi:hypothetical protein HHX47_DHR8000161 [Lentinula edodes]|nr:hypothetical protein HHX47_DHR8000161 [Lentinula edodes]
MSAMSAMAHSVVPTLATTMSPMLFQSLLIWDCNAALILQFSTMSVHNSNIDLSCFDPQNPHLSCRRLFPHKDYEGLCARCLHLSTIKDSEELKRDAGSPVCQGCGAIVAFMAPGTKLCGSCERKEPTSEPNNVPLPRAAISVSSTKGLQAQKYAVRSDAMANRMLPKKSVAGSHAATSAVQSSGATGGRIIKVYLAPVAPRTLAWQKLGVATGNFSENEPWTECFREMLQHWNVPWEKSSKESLAMEHVNLRFFGNIAIHPGSDLRNIGHFHDVHEDMLADDRTKRCPSTTKPPKSAFVYLEGVIDVDELIVGNEEWVAKRFWNIGQGDNNVSINENRAEVEAEVVRLHRLQKLLAEFVDHARKNKVSIASDIKVTAYKIGVEVVGKGARPSPASGLDPEKYDTLEAEDHQIVWLLEPMRPRTATKKWSGTMQHPGHNSKVGDTLTSFVHFAYQWTYETVVFADLQSE